MHTVRSNFHNCSYPHLIDIVERAGCYKQIAAAVKGYAARPRQPSSKSALETSGCVFVNRTTTVAAIAIDGNEQVVNRAICGYCSYCESESPEHGIRKLRYGFHVFISFHLSYPRFTGAGLRDSPDRLEKS